MPYAPKVVLQLPIANLEALAPFVEACLQDGVVLIAIVGDGARTIEDEIDCLIVGEGSEEARFIVTTAHPDETLDETLEFAGHFGEETGGVQLVRL